MPATPAIVVTGASSGIGVELARQAPAGEHTVVLVARTPSALEDLRRELVARGRTAVSLPLDLGARDAGDQLEAALAEHGLACDILVNNAGFGLNGPAATLGRTRQLDLVDLNVRALTDLSLRFLPGMIARGRGGILNVASVAAFMPGPFMAGYYASKAYVRSFSEALWQETRGTGVTVTCLAPGPVATPFLERSGVGSTRLFKLFPKATAADVARAGWLAYAKQQRIVVPGVISRLNAMGGTYLPSAFTLWFIGATQRNKA